MENIKLRELVLGGEAQTAREREREREREQRVLQKYCKSGDVWRVVRCGGITEAVYKSMVREASGLVQSNPSVKGEYGIARDGERGKGQSEQ